MKKKQDDLYIKILTFGKDNIGKPIKFTDLKQYLEDEGYEYDEFAAAQFFTSLFKDKNRPTGNHPNSLPWDKGEYFLEHTGYFHLLEHEELVSARKSSFYATIFASIAIVISIISTGISIYFSNTQLNTPITIKESQFKNINNTVIEKSIKQINTTQDKILLKLKEVRPNVIENNTKKDL